MWELREEYRRVGEKRGKVRKQMDVPLQSCTNLPRLGGMPCAMLIRII
jgi:hypothetical protein